MKRTYAFLVILIIIIAIALFYIYSVLKLYQAEEKNDNMENDADSVKIVDDLPNSDPKSEHDIPFDETAEQTINTLDEIAIPEESEHREQDKIDILESEHGEQDEIGVPA